DGDLDLARSDPAYAAAFREYGIDVQALPTDRAAARVREQAIGVELAAALDDWAWVRQRLPRGKAAGWDRLLAVARAAGPGPWRNRLREALARKDRAALQELAKSADVAALPVPTLGLLGQALGQSGDPAGAVALLRRAQLRHPGDFW